MRILVTGGGGFIGSALVSALAQRKDTAIVFDTVFPKHLRQYAEGIEYVQLAEADITDPTSVYRVMYEQRPDAVIHCAAVVGVLASLSPRSMLEVNVIGAMTLMEAARLYDVKRFIHVSSEEVLGNFRDSPASEEHPAEPVMPYGITKLAVELLGRSYQQLHGLECLNVRTSWVYGPGLPRARVPKTLVEAAVFGSSLHLPYGADSAIDHTYIEDLVDGVLRVLDKTEHAFDVYNISSGAAPTLKQVVEVVRSHIPAADISVGPGAFRHRDDIPMVQKGALDIARARAALGYTPRFNIEKGIERYINSYNVKNNSEE